MPRFVVRSVEKGLDLIRHPEIVENFNKALRWKPQNRTAVLVPCAGTKPFPAAPSHRDGYLAALGQKDVDLWVVSEPLGVVPYAWSLTPPNNDYDFPPRYLRDQAWLELAQRVARWLEVVAPKYEKVYVALPAHHTKLLAGALRFHDPGNVVDVTHGKCLADGACPTGHGRATSTKYRAFLKRRVANPPSECDLVDVEAYQEVLTDAGVALGPMRKGVSDQLCSRLTEGSGDSGPPFTSNLVVAKEPVVANLASAGLVQSRLGWLLLLPPETEYLDRVRDALYLETFRDFFTMRDDPWAEAARGLLTSLEKKTKGRKLALGPRSTLCHQGQVVARAGFWSMAGRPVQDPASLLHEKCDGEFASVRVEVPEARGARVPRPAFVQGEFCTTCLLGSVELKLGLAQIRPRQIHESWTVRHAHSWFDFRLPIADLSPEHHFGFVRGRVCLGLRKIRSASGDTEERCLEVQISKVEAKRAATYGIPGALGVTPEPGLKVDRSHVHTWTVWHDPAKQNSRIFCATCDAVIARAQPQAAEASRRVAANPAWIDLLPKLGEGDVSPDLIAGKISRTA